MNIRIDLKKKKQKKLVFLIKSIFGVGLTNAKKMCVNLGYTYNTNVKNVSEKNIEKIMFLITVKYKLLIENELKKNIYNNIKTMKLLKSYKGIRHINGKPVNGQRTRTNGKTRKKWK